MKSLNLIFLLSLSLFAFSEEPKETDNPTTTNICESLDGNNSSGTCFKKGERISGMNKICTYRCVTGDKSITISSTELCPLTID
tara:strand:+ start:437 stop:688 length:252 start_codon:yes stop_codon:yes gene_type:complete